MNFRTKGSVIFFLLIVSKMLYSQNREIIYVWPVDGTIQSEKTLKQYAIKSNGITRIHKVEHPSLEVFKPKHSIDNNIGIIVCPGGGYSILAIDLEGTEIANWLNKLGYTAFVLKYRVPSQREAAFKDLKQAIKIVKLQSENYKINPNNIGVLGFSAGGHLCARVSFNKEITSVTSKNNIVSDKPNFILLIYPAYLDEGKNNILSPELNVDKIDSPVFIFSTEDDPYANSALIMANALEDKNAPFEFHFSLKGGHGYGLRKGNIAAETWPVLAETWLRKINSK